jgi:hypothetical protein
MKVISKCSNSAITVLLLTASLLVIQQSTKAGVVNADSPSCPTTLEVDAPAFDFTCQNSCVNGPNPAGLVGPGILTSGVEASKYDVAALYFGHQN